MHIGYITERKGDFKKLGWTDEEVAEFDEDSTVAYAIATMESLGHTVDYIGDCKALVKRLAAIDSENEKQNGTQTGSNGARKHKYPWDLVFNNSEGTLGSAREAQVPGILEAYGIPFTMSDALTLSICLDKALTKTVLEHHGIPTAPFARVTSEFFSTFDKKFIAQNGHTNGHSNGHSDGHFGPAQTAIQSSPHTAALQKYPLFVKPNSEGTSKGVLKISKCNSADELEAAVDTIARKYPGQDVLIESFLAGVEFTVGVAGTGPDAKVVGVRQIGFPPGSDNFQSLDTKIKFRWEINETLVEKNLNPAKDEVAAVVAETALKTWRILKCRDLGRVDIRFDHEGEGAVPHVMEVNPIPGMTKGWSELPLAMEGEGFEYSFEDMYRMILESAAKRI